MDLLVTQILSKEDLKELIGIFNKKVRVPNDKNDIPVVEQS